MSNKLADLFKSKETIEAEIAAIKEKERKEAEEKDRQERIRYAEEQERKEREFLYSQIKEAARPLIENIGEELFKDPKFIPVLLAAIDYVRRRNIPEIQMKGYFQMIVTAYKEENK